MSKFLGAGLPGLLAMTCVIGGCYGEIQGDKAGSPTVPGPGGSVEGLPEGQTVQTAQTALPRSGLRRLTQEQYKSSVTDLLGDNLDLSLSLPADQVAEEGFEFISVGASQVTTSGLGVQQYDAFARALADQVFADVTHREAFVGCTSAALSDDCVTSFLQRFGRSAFRRPLSDEELARYRQLVNQGQLQFDVWRGLQVATTAFLNSPNFLYRVEVGFAAPQLAATYRLDDFEVATRLSYLLWNTTPDGQLLDAAAAGQLAQLDGLRQAAMRLLDAPRAEAPLVQFFSEWLGFKNLDQLPKDPLAFPAYTDTLRVAMRQQFERTIAGDFLRGNRSLMEIFSTRDTYVNFELAKLYGLPGITGSEFVRVTFPSDGPRVGLLTLAGLLAANSRATMTSPTLRGRFISERLLCRPIAPPPPNVKTSLPPPPADGHIETMRERLTRHATDPACAGCHRQMDPFGLALEHFDGVGVYRELDQGQPINTSGELDGVAFDGAIGLGALLAGDPRVASCVGRNLARHAWGQAEGSDENWIFDILSQRFAGSGYSFKALVLDLVTHDSFRFSGGPR